LALKFGYNKRKVIPGWNDLVQPLKEECQFYHQIWLSAGKPSNGDIFWNMRMSKNNFKELKENVSMHMKNLKRINL